MRVVGYAYPWDVYADPGFLARTESVGVDEVAVAVAYHSTRAATPWQPLRTSVLARHAALYRPIRASAWARPGALRPGAADWLDRADPAGDAVRMLDRAGIPTAAWVVLTHNSRLGTEHPELAVRNCFGEPYPWALCPSREQVRDYAARLAAEAVRELPVRTVLLEACGQLGLVHQNHHEKTDSVWSPAAARVLSVCCCGGCTRRWSRAGGSPDRIVAELAELARKLIADPGFPHSGPPHAELLLACRQASTDELRHLVLDAVRATLGERPRIALHASTDPWATGALPGLTPSAAAESDTVVLPCWVPGTDTVDAVASARAVLPPSVRVGAYVTAVGGAPPPDPAGYVRELVTAGAGELHLYHLGLAGPAQLPGLREAGAAAHGTIDSEG